MRRRWTATPTSGGWPATTSTPASRRGGCAPTSTRCGSSRWSSTARRPGRSRRRCTRRSPRPTRRPRTARPREIIGWLAEHATTRVGPRGRQVQVPVEQLEAAMIRHYTSRAGDPHRHLHLQVNARVWAAGAWRGIHTVGVRDSLDAINGIGHAAVICDPEFRAALAAHGYPLDRTPARSRAGAVTPGRSAPGRRRSAGTSTGTRPSGAPTHPGEEPGRGCAERGMPGLGRGPPGQGRPARRRPSSPEAGVDELRASGSPQPDACAPIERCTPIGAVDRDAAVDAVLSRLGARRSAWNAADVRGEVEQLDRPASRSSPPAGPVELAEDLTARALDACVPLLERDDVPEHVRALTSPRVLAVEADLTTRLTTRAAAPVARRASPSTPSTGWTRPSATVVAALAGQAELLVIEGAAGAGKTTTLAAAHRAAGASGRTARGGHPDAEGRRRSPPRRSAPRRSRRRGLPTSTGSGGTTTAAGPADPVDRARRRRPGCGPATSCWSTRPGCSTRTPPAPCSPSPTRPAPGSR